ncbi:MAG: MMPL family transporter [Actinocatenispora sp.]
MSAWLGRLGLRCASHPWLTVLSWLLFALFASGLAYLVSPDYAARTGLPGTESQHATAQLERAFPGAAGTSATVVVTSRTTLTDGPGQRSLGRIRRAVVRLPHVEPGPLRRPEVSPGGHAALLTVSYRAGYKAGGGGLHQLREALDASRGPGLRTLVTGQLPRDHSTSQTGGPERIGFVVVVIVLLLAFGSVVSAAVPVVTGAIALVAGLGLVRLLALVYPVDSAAPALGSMIGLGVGIDYALFIVTRHREELDRGHPPVTAAANATAAAGSSVVYAGVTVIVASVGLVTAGIPLIISLGLSAALVVVVAVLSAITLVPALLALAGRRVDALHLPFRSRHPPLDPEVADQPVSRWQRWAGHIGRYPLPYTVGFGALLLVLAVPLGGVRLGEPDDSTLPAHSEMRQAYQLVSRNFGIGRNAPLQVVAVSRAPLSAGVLDRSVGTALHRDRDVASVAPAVLGRGDRTALITVVPRSAPQSTATADLVERLRGTVLPAAARHPALRGDDTRLLLTGEPAGTADFAALVTRRLPVFVGVVLLLSFLLLTLVFRSLLVPLKAVVLNVLSICAAYGLLVAAFQWGWLTGVLGLHDGMPIVSVVPMMMFAIVFGLSMDYEVFLLSRIREEWLRTGDSTASVVSGIAVTARTISAAAAIMVCVFLIFTFSAAVVVKMMGLGLAVAVLVDATVIRLILVPGLMVLFGRANWWLPRWLDRRLPDIHLEI